jgi:hypothetical protein
MIEYISYIIVIFTFFGLLAYLYTKYTYGFWMDLPVFHEYDWKYKLWSPGIINHTLPEKDKYTNFKNIQTRVYSELSDYSIQQFIHFIKLNNGGSHTFMPKVDNIRPYFTGHNSKTFITFYKQEVLLIDATQTSPIRDSNIIGTITSRPINIRINNGDDDAVFDAYYIDYIYFDFENKVILPELFKTHIYNQCHINHKIGVHVFKQQGQLLTGIVPLCKYKIYEFSVDKWTKPMNLDSRYNIVEINTQNIYLLYEFIKENSVKFDIVMNSDASNLVELIKSKNLFIYMVVNHDVIICAYFFKKTCLFKNKELEILSLTGSIKNCNNDVFVHAFKICFWKIAADNYMGYAMLENISHNNIIIDNLCLKTKPQLITDIAYYFYNFIYNSFQSNKVFVC